MKRFYMMAALVCTLGVNAVNAMPAEGVQMVMNVNSADDFIGKWLVKIPATPMGDIEMKMEISKNDKGEFQVKFMGDQADAAGDIDSIKAEDKKFTINLFTQGTAVDIVFEMVDADNLKGSTMGMFDNTATRIKE